MAGLLTQFFFIPTASITEQNCPDQSDRVFIVTGGYAGVGFELSQILYAHNAIVHIAGRSQSKASTAIARIKDASPKSVGRLEFMNVDLSDLSTIKPGVGPFLAQEQRLDVLVNNAGVMFPPKGSVDAQGNELQIGTNCLGPLLLYRLLQPILTKTAASSPKGSVRVIWAGSSGIDLLSPKPNGMELDDDGRPKDKGVQPNYGQSKVGNLFLARHFAQSQSQTGAIHACFNPGNLKTELQRHWEGLVPTLAGKLLLYPAIYGAYTELWTALSPDLTPERSGAYTVPWGRIGGFRSDIEAAMKPTSEKGTGVAAKFVACLFQIAKGVGVILKGYTLPELQMLIVLGMAGQDGNNVCGQIPDGCATTILTNLSNPLNVTLLTSQLLCAPSIWEQRPVDGLRTTLRILGIFNSAAIHRVALGVDQWATAAVKGTDGARSPRWRHLCVLVGLLIGFEGRDKITTSLRRKLESATVKAVNLALHEGETANELAGNSVAMMLSHVFDLLGDAEKLKLEHDLLLPILYQSPLFSKDGLHSGYFLSSIDAEILQRGGTKFDWSSNSSTYVQCQHMATGPLISSLGSLSRVTAFSVEHIQNVDLLSTMVNDLSNFTRSLCVQWRQNKLSEIDTTEEATFLSDETLKTTLPVLWRILKSSMFAIVIILRALLGHVLGDPRMPVAGAPFIAVQTLEILRNLYFISSRLGANAFSQYTFVYLTAIDILSQYPVQAEAFLQEIRPTSAGRIPQHPLDRCHDLFFLNTAEHFTNVLAPEVNEAMLVNAATPYLGLGSDPRLLEIFEAAHSVMLAVFSAPGASSRLFAKHIRLYVEVLFRVFPQNVSERQFRMAIKTLVRITFGIEPSVILELVRQRLEKAPSDQSTALVLALIDALACLPLDQLEDWLPIILLESRNHSLDKAFWQAITSREMDADRAAMCLRWWTRAETQQIPYA